MATLRKNVAHLTPAERDVFVQAVRQADLLAFSDSVSYWDKQDQIHQGTHNHGGPSFIPWHRELCNRFEKLIQQVNPDTALHYWDWTTDPRSSPDGNGGTVNICTDTFFGTANGTVGGVLAPLHNGGNAAGSRDSTGNPADPPRTIVRNCQPGAPQLPSDNTILLGANALPQAQQWQQFRNDLESAHNSGHGFFGPGSSIFDPHSAFEDPFVFLMHSNVDRLFAMWQTATGANWRLDPDQVYGSESNSTGSTGILQSLQPWNGTVEFGSPITPWTNGSSAIEVKNSRHPSVVRPSCYDTLPVTVTQVTPAPGDPIRFIDVPTGEETARALRLRIRGCRQVICQAQLAGGSEFSLLNASVNSPEPTAFESRDLLVWVIFKAGAVGTTASSTLTVSVPATGDTFTIPVVANVVVKPSVGASLVLDSSGSMDALSGVAALKRIEVLRNSAPLFVHLLDDADGVGVVRFDTDATPVAPVTIAGGQIAGAGRTGALNAVAVHATNPAGLTAIGDGIEAAALQLAAASGFDQKATVVFTDGHETADKRIGAVTDLINSRVFAIGLGTADQLNPGTLDDLVKDTGGYLLLTGNSGPDDQILLQKYFAQIIAGVTNSQIVVDPEGFVMSGMAATIPYDLTESDSRSDVIVLSPLAEAFTVSLEAPDGTTIDNSNGATIVRTAQYQTVRLPLPAPATSGPTGGVWHAHLKVDARRLRRLLDRQEGISGDLRERVKTHGVPYTVTVQARSSVRLDVRTLQSSRNPGSAAIVTAVLTEAGIPLGNSARVTLTLSEPGGTKRLLPMAETDDGLFTVHVDLPDAGVYRALVRAEGGTLRGNRFTREELRSLAVWSRGDGPTQPTGQTPEPGFDVCGFISCLLGSPDFQEAARRIGIDPDSLRRCLNDSCRT
jgi:hypothetical protein